MYEFWNTCQIHSVSAVVERSAQAKRVFRIYSDTISLFTQHIIVVIWNVDVISYDAVRKLIDATKLHT